MQKLFSRVSIVFVGICLIGAGCMPAEVTTPAPTPDEVNAGASTEVEDADENVMGAGSYEVYAPEKLALAENGDVVLFFRASWCPTCREVDSNIRANLEVIPAGLTILDVNYDDSTALKRKYGVTYQHTFVQVDASGNQITKWSGSPTLADLVEYVK